MGESFGKLISSVREKMATPLYDSGGVRILRLEDSKTARPKSQELQEAHPELYDFLLKRGSRERFNVGVLHLDSKGAISRELASFGENPLQIAQLLRDSLRAELMKIATKMREEPGSNLAQIDFLTGVSRFFRAERVARELGFEIFDIDDGEELKFDSSSHRRAGQTYDAMSKMGIVNKVPNLKEKPAKIGLLSKQALLDLLEK